MYCNYADMSIITTIIYHSPAGELVIGDHNGRICMCDWALSRRHQSNARRIRLRLNAEYAESTSDIACTAITQIDEYFTGKRRDFTLPLLLTGTEFQSQVWNELLNIPYGSTISYATLAQRIGRPDAVRAVASAVASNPISILVPCHRVVGSDGSLTGYAGGIDAKRILLGVEKHK